MLIFGDSSPRYWVVTVLFLAGPTLGQTTDAEQALAKFQADAAVLGLAHDLGAILGSEEFCNLDLDQDGLAAWVAKNVPPDRMDFTGQLQLATMGQQGFNAAMSDSAKTAHCAAVTQAAEHSGLIKPK